MAGCPRNHLHTMIVLVCWHCSLPPGRWWRAGSKLHADLVAGQHASVFSPKRGLICAGSVGGTNRRGTRRHFWFSSFRITITTAVSKRRRVTLSLPCDQEAAAVVAATLSCTEQWCKHLQRRSLRARNWPSSEKVGIHIVRNPPQKKTR